MLNLLPRETPELPKTGRRWRRNTRTRPNTAQRHPSNIESDCVYVHWCSRGWKKHKRQTRSTARIRKRNTSDDNWEEPSRTVGESLDMEAARFPRPLPKEGLAVEREKAGTEREEGRHQGA